MGTGAGAGERPGLRGIAHAHSTRSFDGHLSYPELQDVLQRAGLFGGRRGPPRFQASARATSQVREWPGTRGASSSSSGWVGTI